MTAAAQAESDLGPRIDLGHPNRRAAHELLDPCPLPVEFGELAAAEPALALVRQLEGVDETVADQDLVVKVRSSGESCVA